MIERRLYEKIMEMQRCDFMKVLDCTLRDGGYVNDWNFGRDRILKLISKIEETGIEGLELGFLRDVKKNPDSSNLSCIEDAVQIITTNKDKMVYSAMIEAFEPYPLDKLEPWHDGGVDLIRICIWKRCLKEHLEYCERVKNMGYRISIQPSRVEQYSYDEFYEMLNMVNRLEPYAVYVVDTWGTQSSKQIEEYIKIADYTLNDKVILGYHGHNNKMQALDCVSAILKMNIAHELCFDSTLLGMGRGAGNLNTEILLQYLNEFEGAHYNVEKAVEAAMTEIQPIYENTPWGYSLYYFLSAVYGVNPNFATYFQGRHSVEEFKTFLESLGEKEKIVFSPQFVETRLEQLGIGVR